MTCVLYLPNFMFHWPLTNPGSDCSDRIGLEWQFALNSKLHWKWLLVSCCMTARDLVKADRCGKTSCWWKSFTWHLKRSFAYWQQVITIVPCSEGKAFNLGSVKNKTNSEESRDGKKHKISAIRDTYISLCRLWFGQCHMTNLVCANCNGMKLCNRKFPVQFSWK